MPVGLHIEFADGGPDMNITAGMRGLKYVGSFGDGWGASQTFPEIVPGSAVYLTPYSTYRTIGNWTNGQIQLLNGYSVNGQIVTQQYGGNNWGGGSFHASVWQVDKSSPKSGLLIADSSDFTSISNNLALGFCVFRGVVTINGYWYPPIPPGATGVTVFAKFDNPGATLFYAGGAISSWGNNGTDTYQPAVTAKIVVFASGIEPVPQQGGLNMWNAAGKCTFSSGNRPFITYGRTVGLYATGWSATGGDMVQLCCTGTGVHGQDRGNTEWTKAMGVSMSSGAVSAGWGPEIRKNTDYYPDDQTTFYVPGFSVLAIPDIYV
ncbi:TPA: DUF6453 family protein [Kluyvera cryocrescens]